METWVFILWVTTRLISGGDTFAMEVSPAYRTEAECLQARINVEHPASNCQKVKEPFGVR